MSRTLVWRRDGDAEVAECEGFRATITARHAPGGRVVIGFKIATTFADVDDDTPTQVIVPEADAEARVAELKVRLETEIVRRADAQRDSGSPPQQPVAPSGLYPHRTRAVANPVRDAAGASDAAAAPAPGERRRWPRFATNLAAIARSGAPAAEVRAVVVNASEGGLFLAVHPPSAVGSHVVIEIPQAPDLRTLVVAGRVARRVGAAAGASVPSGVGVEIVGPPPEWVALCARLAATEAGSIRL